MGKIFHYELRRLVGSKFFTGLLAVTLWYGWQILNTVTILGAAHTAPFSPWSFGSYLAQLLPLLSMALLFCIWNQGSEKARQTEILTAATPVDPGRYLLVKCGAVVAAWLLLALAVVFMGIGFLAVLFGGDVPYADFLLPTVATLLPAMVFLLGIGLLAGRIHSALLLAPMALTLGFGFLPLPMEADLYGASFFAVYPLELSVLDPKFSIPTGIIIGKLVFSILGFLLLLVTYLFNSSGNRKKVQ